MEVLLALVIGGIVFCGMLLYFAFSWGYVLYMFYGWFVLPVFTELPIITLYQAMGLSLFIGLFKNHAFDKEYKDHEQIKKGNHITSTLLYPWLVLIIGVFIKSIIY